MSDSANRSFERITRDDLMRLAQLALGNFDDFFARNPKHAYGGQLRLICLLQTAAKHFVDPDPCVELDQRRGGVNDFDVCGFFQRSPGRHLFAQRRCELDFGPSKFGRNPEEGERFKGRRVDVLWRSIGMRVSEAPIESVQRYLQDAFRKRLSRTPGSEACRSSPERWAATPVVVLYPTKDLGRIIWRS